jgi:hypothetical protein
MSLSVACQCGARFTAKDELQGRTVRCPKCGGTLTISAAPSLPKVDTALAPGSSPPAASPAAPKIDTAPTAGRPSPATSPEAPQERALIVVETGLSITFFALVAMTACSAIMSIALIVAVSHPAGVVSVFLNGPAVMGRFVFLFFYWCFIASMASVVSLITGGLVCRTATGTRQEQTMIHAALAGPAVALAVVILLQLVGTMGNPLVAQIIIWLLMLLQLFSCAAFAIFVGAVGERFGNAGLRQQARLFSIFMGGVAGWLTLFMFLIRPGSSAGGKVVMSVTLLLLVGGCAWMTYLVYEARKAARRRA